MPRNMYITDGRKIFSIARKFFSDLSRKELDFFLGEANLREIGAGALFTPTVSFLPRTFWHVYNKVVGGNH